MSPLLKKLILSGAASVIAFFALYFGVNVLLDFKSLDALLALGVGFAVFKYVSLSELQKIASQVQDTAKQITK